MSSAILNMVEYDNTGDDGDDNGDENNDGDSDDDAISRDDDSAIQ